MQRLGTTIGFIDRYVEPQRCKGDLVTHIELEELWRFLSILSGMTLSLANNEEGGMTSGWLTMNAEDRTVGILTRSLMHDAAMVDGLEQLNPREYIGGGTVIPCGGEQEALAVHFTDDSIAQWLREMCSWKRNARSSGHYFKVMADEGCGGHRVVSDDFGEALLPRAGVMLATWCHLWLWKLFHA